MESSPEEQHDPRILLFDLETSPNLGFVWQKWQTNVIRFESEWQLLSVAWKWLGERSIEAVGQDTLSEEELVKKLHSLMDEADITIAHNGDSFDNRMASAKFIEFDLPPPSPYRSVDTKKIAKRYFRFTSNTLGDLGNKLGLGSKGETGGFDTWLGCMAGDQKAWNKMLRYNKQDVRLLEKVYLKMRPWAENHPAINMIKDDIDACPKCGDDDLQKRGVRHTNTMTYQRYQCQGCNGWCRSRKAVPKEDRVRYVN